MDWVAFVLLSDTETVCGSQPFNTAPSPSDSPEGCSLASLFSSHTLPQDSGQKQCWQTEWWAMDMSVLPMSLFRSQNLAAVHRWISPITVIHPFVDALNVFTRTRKYVIWWKALLVCKLTTTYPTTTSRLGVNISSVKRHWGFILSSSKNNISIFLLKQFNQMLCRLKPGARSSFWAWTESLDMMSQSAVWIAFKMGLQVCNERQSCKSLTFQTDVCDFCTWWIWSSENPFCARLSSICGDLCFSTS